MEVDECSLRCLIVYFVHLFENRHRSEKVWREKLKPWGINGTNWELELMNWIMNNVMKTNKSVILMLDELISIDRIWNMYNAVGALDRSYMTYFLPSVFSHCTLMKLTFSARLRRLKNWQTSWDIKKSIYLCASLRCLAALCVKKEEWNELQLFSSIAKTRSNKLSQS